MKWCTESLAPGGIFVVPGTPTASMVPGTAAASNSARHSDSQ
ncbi:hypothetical protein VKA52_06285 [Halobacillus sp. HZG1]|nr:hypothetical protein [Halobacillus sp. HZG1]MEC3883328.1 hypothetical protein [Halobacillus sp. HZG1]